MNRAKVEGQTKGDGDLVSVRQQERADPGKIVVALVASPRTVCRVFKKGGEVLQRIEK